MSSYTTERKIKIIIEQLGPDWEEKYPNQSIDRLYTTITGDDRKNLFCKVNFKTKMQLDEMTLYYDTKMSEFIENLIRVEYTKFQNMLKDEVKQVAKQFAK